MSQALRGKVPISYKVAGERLLDEMFEQSPVGSQVGEEMCRYAGRRLFQSEGTGCASKSSGAGGSVVCSGLG